MPPTHTHHFSWGIMTESLHPKQKQSLCPPDGVLLLALLLPAVAEGAIARSPSGAPAGFVLPSMISPAALFSIACTTGQFSLVGINGTRLSNELAQGKEPVQDNEPAQGNDHMVQRMMAQQEAFERRTSVRIAINAHVPVWLPVFRMDGPSCREESSGHKAINAPSPVHYGIRFHRWTKHTSLICSSLPPFCHAIDPSSPAIWPVSW